MLIKPILLYSTHLTKIEEQVIIKFMKKKVTRTTAVKFLGVLLDAHLSWKPHITELSKKLARTVRIFFVKLDT